jgi:hypothetical protein
MVPAQISGMIQVILYRNENGGSSEFRSRSFRDLADLAKFFASEGRPAWQRAEVIGPGRSSTHYSAEELVTLHAGNGPGESRSSQTWAASL